MLRSVLGRPRLDESFLVIRADDNDDLLGRKACKRVADGKSDLRLAGNSLNCLPRKPLGCAFGDPLCLTECFLVVGEPVEYALPCDRDHDLGRVVLAELSAQGVVCMFDRADHEDVLAHGETVPAKSRTSDDPAEQVVQPNAEHLDLLREPVYGCVGSIELFACLLTRGEQKNQCGDEFAVGGDVDSFLGAKASVESRSRRSRISA